MLDGFVKTDAWISLSCYTDFSKLMHGFVKVVYVNLSKLFYVLLKLKFDQDIKALWSFCCELKVLNEPKYLIPWVPFAMFHVMILNLWCFLCFIISSLV